MAGKTGKDQETYGGFYWRPAPAAVDRNPYSWLSGAGFSLTPRNAIPAGPFPAGASVLPNNRRRSGSANTASIPALTTRSTSSLGNCRLVFTFASLAALRVELIERDLDKVEIDGAATPISGDGKPCHFAIGAARPDEMPYRAALPLSFPKSSSTAFIMGTLKFFSS